MKKVYYCAWAGLYILCIGLGTLQNTTGLLKAALVLIGLIFFVPGALLLYNALTENDQKAILRIRWISLASLGLTTISLLSFFLCAAFSTETAVNIAYDILLLVSAPMACCQYWVLSLFLWACLFFTTFFKKINR